MKIDYPRLEIPAEFKVLVREVVDGTGIGPIPRGWTGILIYHPATAQYYATTSRTPMTYEEIIRLRIEPRWSRIAIALRKMLEHTPEYQFFILPMQARPTIERWLSHNGKRRIATKMGEAQVGRHVLFEVYSPYNKITRYVSAPSTISREDIISLANISLARWLKSSTTIHKHERETMRIALRSKFAVNGKVFESESVVNPTNLLEGHNSNEYRTISSDLNFKAIQHFIASTTIGG